MSKCKITVIKKEYYPDLVQKYCQNPASGPCHRFEIGDEIMIDWDAYISINIPNGFCAEAWHAISHYVYAALQDGSMMKNWMKDNKTMIACCNDGTRPVIFRLQRIDE